MNEINWGAFWRLLTQKRAFSKSNLLLTLAASLEGRVEGSTLEETWKKRNNSTVRPLIKKKLELRYL